MTIADVVKVLNGKLMAGDAASPRVVGAVVANDLMSDVLLFDADDALLLTSLASDQAIRTAHIVGAMGVVAFRNDDQGRERPPYPARVIAALEVRRVREDA